MKFNNLLNRLGINKIYGIIIAFIAVIVIAIAFAILFFFRVREPMEVFDSYLSSLQASNFSEADNYIHEDVRDEWADKFYEDSNNTSASSLLKSAAIRSTEVELVSQSTVRDDEKILRLLINAPDIERILQNIQNDMNNGLIDTTDPEIVRLGENRMDTIIYYAYDNLDRYTNLKTSKEITTSFKKENGFITENWYIFPTDGLHDLLTGQVDEAIDNLNIP